MNSSYDKNPADNIGCGADYITCVLIGFKNIQCENRGIAVHPIIVHGLLYSLTRYNNPCTSDYCTWIIIPR